MPTLWVDPQNSTVDLGPRFKDADERHLPTRRYGRAGRIGKAVTARQANIPPVEEQ